MCPALQALDLLQAHKAAEDDKAMERVKNDPIRSRLRPDRARSWFTLRK